MTESRLNDIEDPLKSFKAVKQLDERMNHFVGTLEDFHTALADITLRAQVPSEIRQHFETAKNLSLYACFAYRFHQVAEFWGFSALEMALRERRNNSRTATDDSNTASEHPMLKKLLKQAESEGWFNSIRDELRWERAYHAACMKKHIEAMKMIDADPELDGVEWVEPNKDEIRREIDDGDPIEPILTAAKTRRDDLAHGSTILHSNSATTLRQSARLINALF